jgi:hypothetical protein
MYYVAVRKSLAILASIAMTLMFLQAPFLHVHQHEENNFHPGPVFHTHFSHVDEPAAHPQIRDFDPDDDAQDQPWFSVAVNHFVVHVGPPERFATIEVVATSQPFTSVEIEGGHDPPALSCLAPRAPPV